VEVLKKAEFTSEQIRVLMDNGICGGPRTRNSEMNVDMDVFVEQNNVTDSNIIETLKITNEKFEYPYYNDGNLSKELLASIKNVDSRIIAEICEKLPNKSVDLKLFALIEDAAKI
jgi:hypothetical protein